MLICCCDSNIERRGPPLPLIHIIPLHLFSFLFFFLTLVWQKQNSIPWRVNEALLLQADLQAASSHYHKSMWVISYVCCFLLLCTRNNIGSAMQHCCGGCFQFQFEKSEWPHVVLRVCVQNEPGRHTQGDRTGSLCGATAPRVCGPTGARGWTGNGQEGIKMTDGEMQCNWGGRGEKRKSPN